MNLIPQHAFDQLERILPPIFTRQEASRLIGRMDNPNLF
jgi:hypothetical protein